MASVKNKLVYPASAGMMANGGGMTLREFYLITISAALAGRATLLGNTEAVNTAVSITDALIAKIDATP